MLWYSDGTIEIGAATQVATGTGTAFLQNVRVGDGLTIVGSASMHEITNIASDTQLTFSPPYAGAAGAGKQYRIAPIQGYVKEAADRLRAISQALGDFANSPNLKSIADLQGAAGQGLRFKGPGEFELFPLGSAASQTVTQSQLDATAGRLLKVGDFSIGGNAPGFAGNLDKLTFSTTVYSSGASNGPGGSFYGWVRHTEVTPGQYSFQEAFSVNGMMWHRALNVGVSANWMPWEPVLTKRNFVGPIVVGDPGYPAIIERGANSNGEFTRFADGTLEVWNRVQIEAVANSDVSTNFAFPHSFANALYSLSLAVTAVNNTHGYTVAKLASNYRSLNDFEIRLNASQTQRTTIDYTAKGRWY